MRKEKCLRNKLKKERKELWKEQILKNTKFDSGERRKKERK